MPAMKNLHFCFKFCSLTLYTCADPFFYLVHDPFQTLFFCDNGVQFIFKF